MEAINRLEEYIGRLRPVFEAWILFGWDMQTLAPEQSLQKHSEAFNYFENEKYRLETSDQLNEILDELLVEDTFAALDDKWKFIVTAMKKDLVRQRRIPQPLFEEFSAAKSSARIAWKIAKALSDYSMYAPYLDHLIRTERKIYQYTDPDMDVYDAMLNQFEEGMTVEKYDALFEPLKQQLLPLVRERLLPSGQAGEQDSLLKGIFPKEKQKELQHLLLEYIGFDFKRGAVGETEHPFTTCFGSYDARITNHFYEKEPFRAVFSAIHEGGHAVFEQQINPEYDNTVAYSTRNKGLHESQSRFYENILGRNINFWKPIYPSVQELFPQLKELPLEDFVREMNKITNTPVRLKADELTYCFHIIIRYEMEKAIFRDGLTAEQLPELWNSKTKEYLGLVPENDAEGILQDSHWSGGSFGYFPTYLLGNIYDGMFLEQMETELGAVDTILAEGRIREITAWLGEKIHWYGNTRTPAEVLGTVCGKEATADPLIRYFKKKYA